MLDTGANIVAIVDARDDGPGGDALAVVQRFGIELISGSVVTRAIGRTGVDGVEVRSLSPDGTSVGDDSRRMPCDLVCVSGGWNPTVHLFSQSQGRLRFDAERAAFVPGESVQRERSAGAARGHLHLSECLADGVTAGADAVRAAGFEAGPEPSCPAVQEWSDQIPLRPLWAVPLPSWRHGKRFVDFQNDVTVADIELAVREGLYLRRTPQALHHAGDGDRPGTDEQRQRARGARRHAGQRDSHRRDHDLPAAVLAGRPRRHRGPRGRRRPDPGSAHADARLACGERSDLRHRRTVDARPVLPPPRRVHDGRHQPRDAPRTPGGRDGRRFHPREDRGAGPRCRGSSCTACTSTGSATSGSAASATRSCCARTDSSSTTAPAPGPETTSTTSLPAPAMRRW